MDLQALGWDDSWHAAASRYADVGIAGRVIRVDRGLCSVLTAEGPIRASFGPAVLEAVASDPLAAPCTGDWVVARRWPDGPDTAEVVLPRRTALIRAHASGRSHGQVLAANMDLVALVVALHPDPNLGRLERMLALAWESGAQPVVVLTKDDVVGDAELVAEDVARAAPGVEIRCTSTVTGHGIDGLRTLVRNLTVALLGASGHGKSSLANALIGTEMLLDVKPIRDDGKGRHTSIRRELLLLPTGGVVIDTPGLRGIGLTAVGGGLAAAFPDVDELAERCRFSDCQHRFEPACAVLAVVATGGLSVRRLNSWRALQRETLEVAVRTDAKLRAGLAAPFRRLSKQQRAAARNRA